MTADLERLLGKAIREASVATLRPASETYSITASRFGGPPYAERGDSWPVCWACGREQSFICQVAFGDCAHPHEEEGLVEFFYCMDCSPWGIDPESDRRMWTLRSYDTPRDDGYVAMEPSAADRFSPRHCLMEFRAVRSLPDWEGAQVWTRAASRLSLESNPDEPWEAYERAREALVGEAVCGTQVGGYPKWVQCEGTPKCSVCRKRMGLLLQVDSEEDAELMWGDLGMVYLFRCQRHPELVEFTLQCH